MTSAAPWEAVKSGAYDYLVKPFDARSLVIRVAGAISAFKKRSATSNGGNAWRSEFPGQASLTPREREVLAQIAAGASNKEAGRRLGNHRDERRHGVRLRQPSERGIGLGASARARIVMRGRKDAANGELLIQLPCGIDAIAGAGETNVHHGERRLRLAGQRDGFLGGRGRADDLEAGCRQRDFGLHGDQKIILDDENARADPASPPSVGLLQQAAAD